MKKTWTDKLADPRPHVVKPAPIDISGMKAGQIMLVPTAKLVDEFIRAIPRGHCIDVKALARRDGPRPRRRSDLPDHDGLSHPHSGRGRMGSGRQRHADLESHTHLARARRGLAHARQALVRRCLHPRSTCPRRAGSCRIIAPMTFDNKFRVPGVAAALIAALLFGAGTPAAKALLASIDPWMLAGLLYLGSGLGLTLYRRVVGAAPVRLATRERGWLAGAVIAGGVVGPVLLMLGLTGMPASGASLLLNAEGVFTALLALHAVAADQAVFVRAPLTR